MMSLLEEEIDTISKKLGLNIKLRDFQMDFFTKAVTGVNGFLRVKENHCVYSYEFNVSRHPVAWARAYFINSCPSF